MLWSKKDKCPIHREDKEWIEDSFAWLISEFGASLIKDGIVILPTKQYFNIDFKGNRSDAYSVLEMVVDVMQVSNSTEIDLLFYNERQQIEFSEGLISEPDEDTEVTSGKYMQYSDGKIEVHIEEQQLVDPISLIATIAHEVAHYKLLGEGRIDENDELLTDLVTIIFGFGIFTANTSVVRMRTWSGVTHTGWQITGGSGYLDFKLNGFALALYAYFRGKNYPEWSSYLEKDVLKEFKKNFKYILNHPNEIKFIDQ